MGIVIVYHPKVPSDDLKKISVENKKRIQKAIESKLFETPLLYGEPLRGQLVPLWKLRVGDYRIIFGMKPNTLYIHAIGNRRDVYDCAAITRERLI